MKATKENIINYIISKEKEEFEALYKAEISFGIESNEAKMLRTSWNSYYKILKEFNLIDKLERNYD